MKKTLVAFALLTTILAGGCAPKSQEEADRESRVRFIPKTRDMREPIAIHIVTSKPEPKIFNPSAVYPVTGEMMLYSGGLAAFLNVFTFLTTKPDSWVQAMAEPLHNLGLGDEFTRQSRAALEQSVRSSDWIKIRAVYPTFSDDVFAEDENTAVVNIDLQHGLSRDGSMVVIEAVLSYLRHGSSADSYDYLAFFRYYSLPVAATDSDAVNIWSANNAQRYRAAVREGIGEITRMANENFMMRTTNQQVAEAKSPPITLTLPEAYGSAPAADDYYEVHRHGDRVIAKARNGTIVSAIPLPPATQPASTK